MSDNNGIHEKDKQKESPFNNIIKKLLFFILLILFSSMFGYMTGYMIGKALPRNIRGITVLLIFLWFIISIYISMKLQIIVHEGGHLIAGLISGYKFVSFRIGRLTIVSVDGKLKLKQYTIAGTAGQCLMKPPMTEDCRFPYILYNLGGVAGNVILSLACLLLYYILPYNTYLMIFLVCCFFWSFLLAIINGIPLKIAGLANDGYNVYSLGKDLYALRSIWIQLTVNALLTEGVRLRDMPEEWFAFDREKSLNNPMIGSLGVLRCAYLTDRMMIDEARELAGYLENAPGILEVLRNELRCELLFMELAGARRGEEIERLYDKKMKKYIKATRRYPSRMRLMYAYELLYEKNHEAAAKQLAAFEKLAGTYACRAEIDSERDMITYVNKLAAECQ
jgi:hypothetical protein